MLNKYSREVSSAKGMLDRAGNSIRGFEALP